LLFVDCAGRLGKEMCGGRWGELIQANKKTEEGERNEKHEGPNPKDHPQKKQECIRFQLKKRWAKE